MRCTPLRVSHAFHSRLMEPIARGFRQPAAGIALRASPHSADRRPELRAVPTLATADYWVRQLRETVRFADGVAALRADGCDRFLEIGPKPVLISLGARTAFPTRTPSGLFVAEPPAAARRAGADVRRPRTAVRGRPRRRLARLPPPAPGAGAWRCRPIRSSASAIWIEPSDEDAGARRRRGRAPASPGSGRRSAAPAREATNPRATALAALRAAGPAERPERLAAYLQALACDVLLHPRDRPLDAQPAAPAPGARLDHGPAVAQPAAARISGSRSRAPGCSTSCRWPAWPSCSRTRLLGCTAAARPAWEGASPSPTPASEAVLTDAEPYPLSHGQRALWFLWLLAPESSAYNQSLPLRLPRRRCRANGVPPAARCSPAIPCCGRRSRRKADGEPLQGSVAPGRAGLGRGGRRRMERGRAGPALAAAHAAAFRSGDAGRSPASAGSAAPAPDRRCARHPAPRRLRRLVAGADPARPAAPGLPRAPALPEATYRTSSTGSATCSPVRRASGCGPTGASNSPSRAPSWPCPPTGRAPPSRPTAAMRST